ncbi:hypothetical protein KAJ27_15470 [bacterium]|nr:hypothetical protein [bacterium]
MALKLNEKTKKIIEKIKLSGQPPVDEYMLPLINAINSLEGVQTDINCDGHGKIYPHLYLCLDGTSESVNGLGIIAHAAKYYHWKVTIVPMGHGEEKQIHFALAPLNAFRFSKNAGICNSEVQSVEEWKREIGNIKMISAKIRSMKNEAPCKMRKPIIRI